jgi:beta-lactamase regulating signal transducer with metallopeptidase domain
MNPKISALAWALIHFLWEGGLIAAGLAVVLRAIQPSRANLRYLISCGAMVLMLSSAVATFLWLNQDMGAGRTVPQALLKYAVYQAPALPASPLEPQKRTQFSAYLPWLVYLWMAGVLALSIRTGAGFAVAQRLKRRQAFPLPPVWEQRFHRLARRLQISRTVRACESAIADVPAVVGWLRPVVLVPASALIGLPAPDVEALLAHELAHIRRNDYLVNLLQTAVETLLFYHPAVWWTGRQIRAERENCCDDLAVAVCGDVLTYARALTRLEQMRARTPALAMAANRGSLLARIRRLVRPDDSVRHTSGDWITGVAILLSVTAIYAAGYVPVPKPLAVKPAPVVVFVASQKPEPIGPRVEEQKTQPDDMQELAQLQAPVAPNEQAPAPSSGFLDGLASAGFTNLDVDDLIQFKIHGVTPEFIRQVKAAGFQPTADELVSMRIHGVDPGQIATYKAAGVDKLSIDDLVSFRIHGVTPEFVNSIRAAGYSTSDADDIVSLRIHGVTPEFAKEVKSLALGNPSLDDLVSMRIHGVTPEFARDIKALNLRGTDLDSLIEMRNHGITSGFIREVQKRGFKDLSVDQIIRLKQLNIFGNSEVF